MLVVRPPPHRLRTTHLRDVSRCLALARRPSDPQLPPARSQRI